MNKDFILALSSCVIIAGCLLPPVGIPFLATGVVIGGTFLLGCLSCKFYDERESVGNFHLWLGLSYFMGGALSLILPVVGLAFPFSLVPLVGGLLLMLYGASQLREISHPGFISSLFSCLKPSPSNEKPSTLRAGFTST